MFGLRGRRDTTRPCRPDLDDGRLTARFCPGEPRRFLPPLDLVQLTVAGLRADFRFADLTAAAQGTLDTIDSESEPTTFLCQGPPLEGSDAARAFTLAEGQWGLWAPDVPDGIRKLTPQEFEVLRAWILDAPSPRA